MNKIKILNRLVILIIIIVLNFIEVDKNICVVVLSWLFDVIIINNIQKLRNKRYEKILSFVRRTFYLIPLVFPFFFLQGLLQYKMDIKSVVFGIFIGILFILPERINYQLFLSDDYIECLDKEQLYRIFGNCYSLIFGSICEELYFKVIIIGVLKSYIGIFSIVLNSYLFFLHHYLTKKFYK
ncbi:MAG: hypothetical protein ACRDDH_15305, partial [Cetobacterium sp.]|uniref:hypothetical protein n=1 Tax=Cetobacterium sp. TaxID=2071632 RepID=UPI003EE5389A